MLVEHAGPLFHSGIAKKYASAQTKTTTVIKSIAHFAQNGIIDLFFNLKDLKDGGGGGQHI